MRGMQLGSSPQASPAGLHRQSGLMTQELHAPAPADATPPAPLRVLVVDDDPDAAESLAFCLQLDGRKVRYVTSGEQALALADSFAPHVALIDVFMPQVDGHALAAQLRQRFGQRIVVIAVTGALKSVALTDFDHHLMKPIDFAQLDALLAPLSIEPSLRSTA
jgi:two-component system, OmpR family, response regulator